MIKFISEHAAIAVWHAGNLIAVVSQEEGKSYEETIGTVLNEEFVEERIKVRGNIKWDMVKEPNGIDIDAKNKDNGDHYDVKLTTVFIY